MNLKKRFPSLEMIAPVYAVIAVIIFGWSIVRFFWRIPSFTFSSTTGEIATAFFYLVTVNLFETLVVLAAPILLSLLLPEKWFYKNFVSKGILLVSLGLGYFIYVARHISPDLPYPWDLIKWSPLAALGVFLFVYLLDEISLVRRILTEIADRLIIFLYMILPLAFLGFLVVLVRNIF